MCAATQFATGLPTSFGVFEVGSAEVRATRAPELPLFGMIQAPGFSALCAGNFETWQDVYYNEGFYCNGAEVKTSPVGIICDNVNFYGGSAATPPVRNPHQAFYCLNKCGRYISDDPAQVPQCAVAGDPESTGIIGATFNQPCKNVCYPPAQNINAGATPALAAE
jgi:hypothetical protein